VFHIIRKVKKKKEILRVKCKARLFETQVMMDWRELSTKKDGEVV
jgi:hypothetical protein